MIDGTSSHNFHHGINGCKYAPIQVPIFWVMSRSPRLKEYTFASGRLKPRASRLHPPRRPVETLKIMLGKGRQSFGILWVHLSMYGAYLHTVVYFSVLICRWICQLTDGHCWHQRDLDLQWSSGNIHRKVSYPEALKPEHVHQCPSSIEFRGIFDAGTTGFP